MGFFRKRQDQQSNLSTLPPDIVQKMERFGRYEFDPQGSGVGGEEQGMLMATLYPLASTNPDQFLTDLAQVTLPVGGWAVYGASRTAWELLSSQSSQHPAYIAILDGAIAFLRANRIPPMMVRGYEWERWLASGGTRDTWMPLLPTPSPEEAPITELLPGEVRKVAQMTALADANLILVRQRDDGRYCALIDARWGEEDPRRVQNEWKYADSLRELFIEIGFSQQIRAYWYDKELEPYIPFPRPTI